MPFTPFHMGPGLLIKSVFQGAFSILIFGWAQILMDIEPLIVLIKGQGTLHGFSHTYLGATLIALCSTFSGKYLSEIGLKVIRQEQYLPITWPVVIMSAFIGTFGHVFLDSLIHSDMHPLYPLSQAQPLLHIISHTNLIQACIACGIIGAIAFYLIEKIKH